MNRKRSLCRSCQGNPSELQKLDGIATKQIISGRSAPDRVDLEFPGDVLTYSDITEGFDLSNYKRSEMWHQVLVVYGGHYTKDVIVRPIYASLKRCNIPMFMGYYEIGRNSDSHDTGNRNNIKNTT